MGLALLWLPASEAALIAYTMPVWAAMLAWPMLGERPTLLRMIALVMAFAGLAAIMGGNGFAASMAKLPGILMALGGAIGFALGTVLAKKFPLHAAAARRPPPGRSGSAACRWRSSACCSRPRISARCRRVRLVPDRLYDRDPVLRRLCQLVRGAGAAAGLGGGDRHHGGAGDRRAVSALALHEPLGVGQIAALVFTLAGVALAARS